MIKELKRTGESSQVGERELSISEGRCNQFPLVHTEKSTSFQVPGGSVCRVMLYVNGREQPRKKSQ
jgi:hypothetical protein